MRLTIAGLIVSIASLLIPDWSLGARVIICVLTLLICGADLVINASNNPFLGSQLLKFYIGLVLGGLEGLVIGIGVADSSFSRPVEKPTTLGGVEVWLPTGEKTFTTQGQMVILVGLVIGAGGGLYNNSQPYAANLPERIKKRVAGYLLGLWVLAVAGAAGAGYGWGEKPGYDESSRFGQGLVSRNNSNTSEYVIGNDIANAAKEGVDRTTFALQAGLGTVVIILLGAPVVLNVIIARYPRETAS